MSGINLNLCVVWSNDSNVSWIEAANCSQQQLVDLDAIGQVFVVLP